MKTLHLVSNVFEDGSKAYTDLYVCEMCNKVYATKEAASDCEAKDEERAS